MRTIALCGFAAASLLSAGLAVAQPAPGTWDLARREAWLQDRIDRGSADGSLAPEEARRVQAELRHIREDERAAVDRDGGVLSPEDRDRLQVRLDDLSDHIHWLRANDFHRPW